jgi:hypothetical protein
VRPSCGDVRDHIASHKNDHRLSYRSWGALQWRSLLKIDFRKIFAAARFSTCVPVKQLVRIWSAAALIAGSVVDGRTLPWALVSDSICLVA